MKQILLVVSCLLLCSQWVMADETLPLPIKTVDITPPKISHTPSSEPTAAGKPAIITAEVKDSESGIKEVSLFFRTKGSNKYNRVKMESADASGIYVAEIPQRYVAGPGVEYYIEASDASGNKILRGVNFSPMVIAVDGAGTSGGEAAAADASDIPRLPTESKPVDTAAAFDKGKEESDSNNWLYWAGGVVATGLVLSLASGGDSGGGGGGDGGGDTGTVVVRAPAP